MKAGPNPLAALAVASLLLAGCSTTVVGTPVADPAAVPKPETGSFGTTVRTLGPTAQADGEALEGFRMAETIPRIDGIDPAMHYRGQVKSTARASIREGVGLAFGKAAADVIGTKPEVWVTVAATSLVQGAKYDAKARENRAQVAVMRMASPDDARAVVGPGLRAVERAVTGEGVDKVEARIPGYDAAVAYTESYPFTGDFRSAFLAYKQYVIGVQGTFSVDQIRTYFDRQTTALDGFRPTPVEKVTTLQRDAEGVARLTLAPAQGDGGYALPARTALLGQTDVTRSEKTFAAAGVDVLGVGGSTVYRARDAEGAQHVLAEFLDENSKAFTEVETEKVTGAPGATCLTYAPYEGSNSRATWCAIAVGRYMTEISSSQRRLAVQGIGAAYLVLRDAK